MDVSPSLIGALAALAVVATWFVPAARRAGRSIRTLRELIDYRYAWVAARGVAAGREGAAILPDQVCAFCGTEGKTTREPLVPRSLRVNERCASCATIQSADNEVPACEQCRSPKGAVGLYGRYANGRSLEAAGLHRVPPPVERKYLNTISACLGCTGALDEPRPGSSVDVLALDGALAAFHH